MRPEDHGNNVLIGGLETSEAVHQGLKQIAVHMSLFFIFDYDESSGPEIGDVLRARNGTWDYKRFEEDKEGPYFKFAKDDPVIMEPFPRIFRDDQWGFITRIAAECQKGPAARFTLEEALAIDHLSLRILRFSRWQLLRD